MSSESDKEMLSEFLMEAWEQIDVLDRELVALEEAPNEETINTVFRVMHTLKGGAGFLSLEMLECLTHFAETLLSRIREHTLSINRERVTLLLRASDGVKCVLRCLEEQGNEGEPRFNDLVVALKRSAEARDNPALTTPTAGEEEVMEDRVGANFANDSRVRVQVDLLDKLMNLVGELVLSRNQMLQVAGELENPTLNKVCQRINMVTGELQEYIMQTRMQPISTLLHRFPRIVRDLCAMTGKDARFTMEGQDTGLDRAILDAIKDPLTHILRNCVDHGLESPEVRLRNGKNARGLIHVRAYHEGGQVTIEILDDGAGVDLARVRSRAVRQRLITPQEAERLSERDALHLLFLPGFSTVEEVTNLSGRGVGMDVVRASVERIGGMVDITTRPGQGSTVKLRLPLTLAIIPALLVEVGSERYAIPQGNLQELVRIRAAEIETIHGAEVYRLRGRLLPLLRLRKVLSLPQPEAETINVVVVSADGSPFGLVVDDICDTEEIVVKPLTHHLRQLPIYAGATVMGDGRVSLILDIGGIARTARLELESARRAEREAQPLQRDQASQSLLLFRLGQRERYAIALSLVSRLEEFSGHQLEYLRGQMVVQYRGRLLPILDIAPYYGCPAGLGEDFQVLVLTHQGRDVGLAVAEILDVVEENVAVDRGSATSGTLGCCILAGRATTIVDLEGLMRLAMPGCATVEPNGSQKLTNALAAFH